MQQTTANLKHAVPALGFEPHESPRENMKVAFFSAHGFEREHFIQATARHGHELVFFKEALSSDTAPLAAGFPAVCAFVTDSMDAVTLRKGHLGQY